MCLKILISLFGIGVIVYSVFQESMSKRQGLLWSLFFLIFIVDSIRINSNFIPKYQSSRFHNTKDYKNQ